jgi:DNA-binding transcriptional MerR regulator
MLNVSIRKVISYTERGYHEASIVAPAGYGSRRLWSLFDLKKLNILLKCEAFGLSPKFLRKLSALLKEEDTASWSNLIIDSKGRAFNEEHVSPDGLPDGDHSSYLVISQEPIGRTQR